MRGPYEPDPELDPSPVPEPAPVAEPDAVPDPVPELVPGTDSSVLVVLIPRGSISGVIPEGARVVSSTGGTGGSTTGGTEAGVPSATGGGASGDTPTGGCTPTGGITTGGTPRGVTRAGVAAVAPSPGIIIDGVVVGVVIRQRSNSPCALSNSVSSCSNACVTVS